MKTVRLPGRQNGMNVLPVIGRELRSQARQPFTYWVRVVGGAVLVAVAGLYGAGSAYANARGSELFRLLNGALFFAIWILVPSITADCLSRERREGTLGLLFLTPLRAEEIVLAKALANGLRAVTVGLAVMPVLTLPLLMGGVSSIEMAYGGVANACAFCLALGAGLLASAWSKVFSRTLIVAGLLGVFFFIALCSAAGMCVPVAWTSNPGWDLGPGLTLLLDVNGSRSYSLSSMPLRQQWETFWAALSLPCGGVLVLMLVVAACTHSVRRRWREEGPTAMQLWVKRRLCTPVLFRSWLRRWLETRLTRNPISWLQQRSWSGRAIAFGWLAVMICYLTAAVLQADVLMNDFLSMQVPIGCLLALSIAAAAASSFRQERESGALELILVTPLSAREVLGGRIRGVWMQFLPATALFLGAWLYLATVLIMLPGDHEWRTELNTVLSMATTYAILPVVGLYYSLKSRHFLAAWACTILVGVVVPWALSALLILQMKLQQRIMPGWLARVDPGELPWLVLHSADLAQVAIALLLARRLRRNLEQRTFVLRE